ncbi:MAG: pyocin knob domain-containing protein [Defluviitaleaceae bacterium]|nr:pyocin knob domain-containing protein [Defluviitaleaceae bacterium]
METARLGWGDPFRPVALSAAPVPFGGMANVDLNDLRAHNTFVLGTLRTDTLNRPPQIPTGTVCMLEILTGGTNRTLQRITTMEAPIRVVLRAANGASWTDWIEPAFAAAE